jgi:hypothetical protein
MYKIVLLRKGLMMKVYKTLTTIFIIIAVILIIIGGIYSIINYKYNQIEKAIYEAELRKANEVDRKEKIKYEAEERKRLQYEAEQNAELEYELMLQTITENSDYYVDFSNKFLLEFEKFGYDEYYDTYGVFHLEKVIAKLENEFNDDLFGYVSYCYICNIDGIILVYFESNYTIRGVTYPSDNRDCYEWEYYCSVIYIPDEYMNEETINTLKTKSNRFTDENIGNNLFIIKHPIFNE